MGNEQNRLEIHVPIDYILTDDPTDANFTFSAKKLRPEEQLMLAVLQNGINQYKNNYRQLSRKQKNQFKEATAWITSKSTSYLYDFESCCHTLGIDANSVRHELLKLTNPYRYSL